MEPHHPPTDASLTNIPIMEIALRADLLTAARGAPFHTHTHKYSYMSIRLTRNIFALYLFMPSNF